MSSALNLLERNNASVNPFSRPQTPAEKHRIAFVGIGAMGYFMARNLAQSQSIPLLIWNRSPAKAEALLAELGPGRIRIAKDLGEVARESDVIITNLANDKAVEEVYEEMVKALKSEIYPALAGELEKLLDPLPHATLITAQVFGAPAAADVAQLLIVTSGDHRAKAEIAHLFVPAVGRKIVDLGGNVEKAPTLKLIGNAMIFGCAEVIGETFTLSEKAGIGAEQALDLVQDLFPVPAITNFAEKMASDNFDGRTGFAIDGGIKDVQHMRRLTTAHSSPMPVIDIVHQHMITARALHAQPANQHHEILDTSAMVAGIRVAAGLDGFDSQKHVGVVRPQGK
ncbi:NAD-P-binding protein [Pterulicium gracile]|uniref:NAD-P-binding protein n=1 Tax=Pterulicium gracile TaxID=1884261 RepID=A0A5C3QBU4_9AGAR|nr:NAD-P-binding protein [Pterula gracilis]